jgi:hypothetical protein
MANIEKIDRKYNRGWRGATYMKRATSKAMRRALQLALVSTTDYEDINPPTSINQLTHGWTS